MDDESWVERETVRQPRAAGPFAGLETLERRRLQASSWAVIEGAQTLLAKAVARWKDDPPRALGFVDRVVRLPFDDFEGAFPAAYAASGLVFTIVTDELDGCPEGDTLWLDAALAALEETDSPARFPVRDALVAIDQDYDLDGLEHRLLLTAVKSIPSRPELRDLTALATDELRVEVIAIVEWCVLYLEKLEEIALRDDVRASPASQGVSR